MPALFIAAFLNQYLANAPRFAILDLGDEQLGVFAIITHAGGRDQHAPVVFRRC